MPTHYDLYQKDETGVFQRIYKELSESAAKANLTLELSEPTQKDKWKVVRVETTVIEIDEHIPVFLGKVSDRYFRLNKDITVTVWFNMQDEQERSYAKGTIFIGELITSLNVYLDEDGDGQLYIHKSHVDFVELLEDGMPDLTTEEWNNIVGD